MSTRSPFIKVLSMGALVFLLLLSLGSFLFFRQEGKAQAASPNVSGSLWSSFASKISPPTRFLGKASQSALFTCQEPNFVFRCYSPAQITKAYNINSLYAKGFKGQGETIVIMDFSQSPTIAQDLHDFDQLFGLPDPHLNILTPFGVDPADPGIATEITLDVEYAHAIAPLATIDLLLVPEGNAQTVSDLYAAFLQGVSYAVDHKLGTAISMSYGFPEPCISSSVAQLSRQIFAKAAANHITTIDSSGDSGATVPNCDFTDFLPNVATQFPAVDPNVLDVGGTYLDTRTSGTYLGETSWAQVAIAEQDNGAGGGGFSTTYPLPSYQANAGITPPGTFKGRAVPDVAYDADPRSGVIVLCSSCGFGPDAIFSVGGTSAGAPQWAGIIALASQVAHHNLGFINPALYKLYKSSAYNSAFHDQTIGNNSYQFIDLSNTLVTVIGFAADFGWDAASGIGSPNVANLIHFIG